MAEYGLVEPFDCDDPMFCYGVEWEMFRQRLTSTQEAFTVMIRHGRFMVTVAAGIVATAKPDKDRNWIPNRPQKARAGYTRRSRFSSPYWQDCNAKGYSLRSEIRAERKAERQRKR